MTLLEGDNWSLTEWEAETGAGSIWQMRVPLPFSLRWVNAYLLRDGERYTIVDPGIHTEAAKQAWQHAMSGMGFGMNDIHRIVLTHYHADHLGLAGWMQQQSGAKVLMSPVGQHYTELLWGPEQWMTSALPRMYVQHGLPQQLHETIEAHMASFHSQVHPLPVVDDLCDGELLTFGSRTWQAIETAGHCPGHISLYDAEHQVLLAGDHVLPQISPNVSYLPNGDTDPLHQYLVGLNKLEALPIRLALPGHRHPFRYAGARIVDLKQHHEERLAQWFSWLQEKPASAYEVTLRAFGTIDKLSVHNFRFAMGETLAHLRELERRGAARQVAAAGVIEWQAL